MVEFEKDWPYTAIVPDDSTSVTSESKPEIPHFRTCPLCRLVKPEAQVKRQIYVDGELVYACSTCYSVHRNNPYAGLLYE